MELDWCNMHFRPLRNQEAKSWQILQAHAGWPAVKHLTINYSPTGYGSAHETVQECVRLSRLPNILAQHGQLELLYLITPKLPRLLRFGTLKHLLLMLSAKYGNGFQAAPDLPCLKTLCIDDGTFDSQPRSLKLDLRGLPALQNVALYNVYPSAV